MIAVGADGRIAARWQRPGFRRPAGGTSWVGEQTFELGAG
jgi:hypothetical protein